MKSRRVALATILLMGPIAAPSGCYSHADVGPAHVQLHNGPSDISGQLSLALPTGLRLRDGYVGIGPFHGWIVGPVGRPSIILDVSWR